jgi:hypothetical protein
MASSTCVCGHNGMRLMVFLLRFGKRSDCFDES